MDIETPPNVTPVTELPAPAETTVVVEKKKFYRNPKVVAGIVASFIAGGVAVVIAGLHGKDSDSDTETSPVESDEIVEVFEETDTTPPS